MWNGNIKPGKGQQKVEWFLLLDESKWTLHGKKGIAEGDQDDPKVKTKLSVHVTSAVNDGIAVQSSISP